MSSLLATLPQPKAGPQLTEKQSTQFQAYTAPPQPKLVKEAPPYGQRQGYIPRKQEDFGDGGAFPEIHVEQFPLDMGRKGGATGSGRGTLAVTVGKEGQVNYEALLKQGRNSDKIVYSNQKSLVPKPDNLNKLQEQHDPEMVQETAQNTWDFLQKIVERKTQASQPKNLPSQPGQPNYVKYTPSQTSMQYNSGAKQRVVRLQDMPVDPLEPPKFRSKKVPRGPSSPPVPVMHSPPKPLTKQEQQDWKIPPSISNWKNPKGYTIPLDKRLAADGRGLQEQAVNSKHASFAEALYYAEDKTRQEIQIAAQIKQERALKKKEIEDQKLRNLALQARQDMGRRGGVQNRLDTTNAFEQEEQQEQEPYYQQPNDSPEPMEEDEPPRNYQESREEADERRQRDRIRMERKRERDREARLANKEAHGYKNTKSVIDNEDSTVYRGCTPKYISKVTRDRERDVGEQVALGQAYTGPSQQHMYDTRLFNQDKGLQSGFANEDQYNIYDKPWQPERNQNLYRPRQQNMQDNELYGQSGQQSKVDTGRHRPDRGFQGADYGGQQQGQLEFEGVDPFGLDQIINQVNREDN